jgi:hypothetical protein
MSEIKARYVGPSPEGVTVGVVLEDGDRWPLTIPQGGELPQEIDGRKVDKTFRDGLLSQEDNWTSVRRDTAKAGKEDKS